MLLLAGNELFGQGDIAYPTSESTDSLFVSDSLLYKMAEIDSLSIDSVGSDSLKITADSVEIKKPSKSAIDSKVEYSAKDSIRFDVINQKAYLYGSAVVHYTDIELTAEYMEVDMAKQEIFASGVSDTSGGFSGLPNFKQGSQTFDSDSLHYNFKSEKGIIYHVVTEQGEGYLHSEKTKKSNTGHIHVKDGKYTTCNAPHPHFYLALTKAMVIPDDKIIAGPSYMVIEDIPIPLGLPFGFFPNSRSRSSGILIPTYGEEVNRGFFLRNGGWYQVLGDHADLTLTGDFYTRGSWAVRGATKYKFKYKFSGNMAVDYAVNDNTDEADFPKSEDFRIRWSHSQDPKANPTQTFSANVNFSSSEFERNNDYTVSGYLTNQKSSSINFSKNWPGTPFNLSLSALASQNSQTERTSLDLPTGSFNANRLYPFRKKESTGKKKWYEDIGFAYKSKFQTRANVSDSLIFTSHVFDTVDFGFKHDIPFFINIKTGKLFTISPSLNYSGRLYNWFTDYEVVDVTDSLGNFLYQDLLEHRVDAFSYAHAINPTIGASFTPKLYGMYASKKNDGYFEALRHVMSPRASASYTPDMNGINPDYYQDYTYINANQDTITSKKSKYGGTKTNLYGTPSAPGQSGSVSLGLSNTLEMKVRPKNDTTGEGKKVTLLENFNFNTSYNPFKDEFRWSNVSWTGGTRVFNKKLDLRFNGSFDLYDLDSAGARINEFRYKNTGKLARMTNFSFTTRYSFKSGKDKNKGEDRTEAQQLEDVNIYQDPTNPDLEFVPGAATGTYVDFSVPWSLNVNYGLRYSKPGLAKAKFTNSFTMNGDFNLTPKWKFGYRASYDFDAKKLVGANFSIHRDLHCWEARITIIPFGPRKSYSFTINAKSSLLRDLKLDKKQSWYDTF